MIQLATLLRSTALLSLVIAVILTACAPEPEFPGHASVTAFTLAERDLLPENVAYDPVDEAFYLGSTRKGKIVRLDRDGTVRDFVAPRQDGLWMAIGMKVDAERRHLWVASSDGDNLIGYDGSGGRAAGVFKFDLGTGELVRKWLLDAPGSTHFFNDLVVTAAGDVYITHMFDQAAVYVIGAERQELEVFARPGRFRGPNGITEGPDGTLYVAHREGISAFDPASAGRERLTLPAGVALGRVDGLYFHRGSLIAIHPDENTVRRLVLDASGRSITDIEVLETEHPASDDPTTGVVVGDDFYYVANSQFGLVDDGELPPVDQLHEVVVLKLSLAP